MIGVRSPQFFHISFWHTISAISLMCSKCVKNLPTAALLPKVKRPPKMVFRVDLLNLMFWVIGLRSLRMILGDRSPITTILSNSWSESDHGELTLCVVLVVLNAICGFEQSSQFEVNIVDEEVDQICVPVAKLQYHEPIQRFPREYWFSASPSFLPMAICASRCIFHHKPKIRECGRSVSLIKLGSNKFLFVPS